MIEMTFVGMYAETSPACVSMIGSAVSEPRAAARRSSSRRARAGAVQVEDVARVGLAARRTAQQQRHLAVGDGLLGEVVVDARAAVPCCGCSPYMKYSPMAQPAYGAMYCSGAGSDAGGDDDDRVLHRAVLVELSTTLATVDASGRSRRRCR